MTNKPRLLIFDIENAANLCFSFDTYEATINADDIVVPSYIFCISFRWFGQKKIHTINIKDFPLFKKDIHDDTEVLKAFAKVFNEADVVVGHNIRRFDIKKINYRLSVKKLQPMEHKKIYDTYQIAKQYFGFNHNGLEAIAKAHGYKGKIQNEKGLWPGCWNGDPIKLEKMGRYNRRDVDINTFVFKIQMPFIKMPVIKKNGEARCQNPACLSDDIQFRGFGANASGRYRKFSCKCGSWGSSRI